VFGDESEWLQFQGYYVATFTVPNFLRLDHCARMFSAPRLSASIGSARRPEEAKAGFVFASPRRGDSHGDTARQKEILREVYAGVGWEVPRLLEELGAATDLYFDAISTVEMRELSRGRVVLLGDAGYGGTLGGQGNGLAMVGAYVLAGELAAARGDHAAAYARYRSRIWSYAKGCQKGARGVGPFHAPRTRLGLALRNAFYRVLTSRPMTRALEKLVTNWSTDLALPEYRLGPAGA
jgi:2-polyprenyl-6-methoxyphenol hydroxylase-like FAD-dependent oxidoreductase